MKSSIPKRGLQEIRTMSERISAADNPQKKYLTLAMLELERARRNKERQSASQRVSCIDQRLADITAEQKALLKTAESEMNAESLANQRIQHNYDVSADGGFKISY